jgi:YVTN family beta-propeller protein
MGASEDPPYLFVTNPEAGDVTVIDVDSQRVIAVVAAGAYPCDVTVTPGGEYALVLNRDSGDMAVIRVAALMGRRGRLAPLFTMIPVGSRPVSAVVWAVAPGAG